MYLLYIVTMVHVIAWQLYQAKFEFSGAGGPESALCGSIFSLSLGVKMFGMYFSRLYFSPWTCMIFFPSLQLHGGRQTRLLPITSVQLSYLPKYCTSFSMSSKSLSSYSFNSSSKSSKSYFVSSSSPNTWLRSSLGWPGMSLFRFICLFIFWLQFGDGRCKRYYVLLHCLRHGDIVGTVIDPLSVLILKSTQPHK